MSEDTVVHQQLKVRDGLIVWRRGEGTVVKQALTMEEAKGLRREEMFLKALDGDFSPRLIGAEEHAQGLYQLILEDLGDGEPVHSPVTLLRNAGLLLQTLHEHSIQHGDLTRPNIIVRNDVPHAIDFSEARWYWESRKPKRSGHDGFHFWPAIADILGLKEG